MKFHLLFIWSRLDIEAPTVVVRQFLGTALICCSSRGEEQQISLWDGLIIPHRLLPTNTGRSTTCLLSLLVLPPFNSVPIFFPFPNLLLAFLLSDFFFLAFSACLCFCSCWTNFADTFHFLTSFFSSSSCLIFWFILVPTSFYEFLFHQSVSLSLSCLSALLACLKLACVCQSVCLYLPACLSLISLCWSAHLGPTPPPFSCIEPAVTVIIPYIFSSSCPFSFVHSPHILNHSSWMSWVPYSAYGDMHS